MAVPGALRLINLRISDRPDFGLCAGRAETITWNAEHSLSLPRVLIAGVDAEHGGRALALVDAGAILFCRFHADSLKSGAELLFLLLVC
jgi:hypothetical protein